MEFGQALADGQAASIADIEANVRRQGQRWLGRWQVERRQDQVTAIDLGRPEDGPRSG